MKDLPNLNCQSKGIYVWICKCGYGYVGQCSRTFEKRSEEHLMLFEDEDYHANGISYSSVFREHLVNHHDVKRRKGIFTLKLFEKHFNLILVHDLRDCTRKKTITKYEDMFAWCFGYRTMNEKSIAVYRAQEQF